MRKVDPFRRCSFENILALNKNLDKLPGGYFNTTTRIVGLIVNDIIYRKEISLDNGRKVKFDPIPPGVYRVREVLDTEGEYGWQFIHPQTGSIMCGHNRDELLKESLDKINIISEHPC